MKSSNLAALLLALLPACRKHEVKVELYTVDGYRFSAAERDAIQEIADRAASDVRALLPSLSRELILRVQAGSEVIPETGETAHSLPPSAVRWVVDPKDPRGVRSIIDRQLRATLFHEFHHLVRDDHRERRTLLDHVISEGQATAFERDHAPGSVPWGDDRDIDLEAWTREVLALPPDADKTQWMFEHPDGRRWIGFRVGTRLADRAAKHSKKSIAELAAMSAEEIVALARE